MRRLCIASRSRGTSYSLRSRAALRDRSNAHPDALAAVVFEGGEAEAPPAVHRAEEHREVAEDLVPRLTESGETAELPGEEGGIALGAGFQLGRLDGLGPIEERPLRGLL